MRGLWLGRHSHSWGSFRVYTLTLTHLAQTLSLFQVCCLFSLLWVCLFLLTFNSSLKSIKTQFQKNHKVYVFIFLCVKGNEIENFCWWCLMSVILFQCKAIPCCYYNPDDNLNEELLRVVYLWDFCVVFSALKSCILLLLWTFLIFFFSFLKMNRCKGYWFICLIAQYFFPYPNLFFLIIINQPNNWNPIIHEKRKKMEVV